MLDRQPTALRPSLVDDVEEFERGRRLRNTFGRNTTRAFDRASVMVVSRGPKTGMIGVATAPIWIAPSVMETNSRQFGSCMATDSPRRTPSSSRSAETRSASSCSCFQVVSTGAVPPTSTTARPSGSCSDSARTRSLRTSGSASTPASAGASGDVASAASGDSGAAGVPVSSPRSVGSDVAASIRSSRSARASRASPTSMSSPTPFIASRKVGYEMR